MFNVKGYEYYLRKLHYERKLTCRLHTYIKTISLHYNPNYKISMHAYGGKSAERSIINRFISLASQIFNLSCL